MPLTDDEKARIRMFLGYPAVGRKVDLTLEGAMATVDGDDATLVVVREILAELAAIDTSLAESRGRLKAAQVDDVKLLGPDEIRTLRREGRRQAARLGRLFDVKPLGAAWEGGGMTGTVGRR